VSLLGIGSVALLARRRRVGRAAAIASSAGKRCDITHQTRQNL
jgi:hypothetical protein